MTMSLLVKAKSSQFILDLFDKVARICSLLLFVNVQIDLELFNFS